MLKAAILEQLGQLGSDQCVMLKLTLPELDAFYAVTHPNVVRVAALSGGYSREEPTPAGHATAAVASFSRALTEVLGPAERRGLRRAAERLDRRHLRASIT